MTDLHHIIWSWNMKVMYLNCQLKWSLKCVILTVFISLLLLSDREGLVTVYKNGNSFERNCGLHEWEIDKQELGLSTKALIIKICHSRKFESMSRHFKCWSFAPMKVVLNARNVSSCLSNFLWWHNLNDQRLRWLKPNSCYINTATWRYGLSTSIICGFIIDPNDQLPFGLIAQLVEYCTVIAQVRVWIRHQIFRPSSLLIYFKIA